MEKNKFNKGGLYLKVIYSGKNSKSAKGQCIDSCLAALVGPVLAEAVPIILTAQSV